MFAYIIFVMHYYRLTAICCILQPSLKKQNMQTVKQSYAVQFRVAECSAHKPSKVSLPYRLNADLSVLFEASTEDHATKSCNEKPTSWQAEMPQAQDTAQTCRLRHTGKFTACTSLKVQVRMEWNIKSTIIHWLSLSFSVLQHYAECRVSILGWY